MLSVQQLLEQKPKGIFSVQPDDPVIAAIRKMAEHHIGALLVMTGDKLVGIVSERDYARKVVLLGRSSTETRVAEIMTPKVLVCSPSDDMVNVMAIMTDRRVRHLPVLDGDALVGIISIGDVVKARMADLESESESLREYIAGREWRELYLHGAAVGANPFAVETKATHGDARRSVG